jgi:N-acetyl-alpha-D-muramate 1-phosphate uridylyltransferase
MTVPRTAMVLAAGLGKRMRPITERLPKPLIPIAGKPLLDWGLDALARTGVETAVVNTHHLAEQVVRHVAHRARPEVTISDESAQLLDSAGGIVNALTKLGDKPFFTLNADTFWIDASEPNLDRLALAWDEQRMDILLMLADIADATGHSGGTDFFLGEDGRLAWSKGAAGGLIYAGAAIVHPRIFTGAVPEPHSILLYFDRAMAAGRLYGMKMAGHWITVGTPDAIPAAEAAVAAFAEGR